MSKELIAHSAHILAISNMAKSLDFYAKKLGFEITFKWNEPVDYAVLRRGETSIHLSKSDQPTVSENPVLYIFVHDIDKLYQELESNGVKFFTLIGTREYQMRDFDIKDPDGHIITFGQGVE